MRDIIIFDEAFKSAKGIAKNFQSSDEFDVTIATSVDQVEKLAGEKIGPILIIGPSAPVENSLALAEKLGKTHKEVGCVLVATALTTDLLRSALRAGIRDVVENRSNEILGAVDRVLEHMLPEAKANEKQQTSGRLITFFSTKGGVGKTVFAVNSAVGLARQGKDVILLDLDNQFGDVGVMLGLKPERTMTDLIPSADRLDAEMLKGFLTNHESGLRALLAPVQYDTSARLTQSQMRQILDAARAAAEYVIIDTPASFAENTLTILDNSDCICLITTLDVPSVKNTLIALQTLKFLNYPDHKINILLNRADSKVSLSPAEVERHLEHNVAVQIPSDRAVPRTVNEGRPLLLEDGRSSIVNALKEVVALAKSVKRQKDTRRPLGRVI